MVCELDGPIPIVNRSATLSADGGRRADEAVTARPSLAAKI
jgi:hypothetical protein